MDSSRRAVEAYWRSRMIDAVTFDEDKVAPVYKIDEVCDLLRSSDVGIVKEVSNYILKRIDNKSPIVKQKALRLIKFSVMKSGVEFRREMQRHSAVIRELIHYRGYPDPLKGDALNKAVRETAQEAMSNIFTNNNDNKAPVTESIGSRIQGFGNKNYEMRLDEKKSFFSEVVDIGRASIEQSLSSIAAAHSGRKSDNGNYRGPILSHSLTNEKHSRDRYEGNNNLETWNSSEITKSMGSASGNWVRVTEDSVANVAKNEKAPQTHSGCKSREERLLETIVTSGGVRLQPTRDSIYIFLTEASKMSPVLMCHAVESKLQSNLWKVRMKALCVLEAMLRKKDDEQFSDIASYFSENRGHIIKCSESPQLSLSEKANKVLSFLEGDSANSVFNSQSGESSTQKNILTSSVPLPDLIDTDYPDGSGTDYSIQKQTFENPSDPMTNDSLVDDLFGSSTVTVTHSTSKDESDPFADVSFHTSEDKEHVDDLFSGLTVDELNTDNEINKVTVNQTSQIMDLFGSESQKFSVTTPYQSTDAHDLFVRLSMDTNSLENKQPGLTFEGSFNNSSNLNEILSGVSNPQIGGVNSNINLPMGGSMPVPYNIPPSMMLNQSFPSYPKNILENPYVSILVILVNLLC
ncbi:VHS domain-containing protein [Zostera marina]|uniref:VHS domain-containing protein n=1 Tax=Zostera marina TaxID=29655 RepID=A0A0K9PHQ0_ZOSMR|nr:VHS domain-containing protein [Zostera marina]